MIQKGKDLIYTTAETWNGAEKILVFKVIAGIVTIRFFSVENLWSAIFNL